jgi:tRNA G10  N-methylase Trm11
MTLTGGGLGAVPAMSLSPFSTRIFMHAFQPDTLANGAAVGDVVLDPFAGSGSTLLAARSLGRRYFGIELDAGYHAIASRRLAQDQMEPATVAHDVQRGYAESQARQWFPG